MSYKYVRPQKSPKKLAQLVEKVHAIDWSPTKDETSALLLENELLSKYKPPFNSTNSRSETYLFISTHWNSHMGLELTLSTQRLEDRQSYGAFRGRRRTQIAFASLARLIWTQWNHRSPSEIPAHLCRPVIPPRIDIPHGGPESSTSLTTWQKRLDRFLVGTSDLLLDDLFEGLRGSNDFYRQLIRKDLNILQDFFAKGPQKNHRLKKSFQLPNHLIEPAWLDDLLSITSSR